MIDLADFKQTLTGLTGADNPAETIDNIINYIKAEQDEAQRQLEEVTNRLAEVTKANADLAKRVKYDGGEPPKGEDDPEGITIEDLFKEED